MTFAVRMEDGAAGRCPRSLFGPSYRNSSRRVIRHMTQSRPGADADRRAGDTSETAVRRVEDDRAGAAQSAIGQPLSSARPAVGDPAIVAAGDRARAGLCRRLLAGVSVAVRFRRPGRATSTLFWSTLAWVIGLKLLVFCLLAQFHGWWRYVTFADLAALLRATIISLLSAGRRRTSSSACPSPAACSSSTAS